MRGHAQALWTMEGKAQNTFKNNVIAALLTSDDDVELGLIVLESLWSGLDFPISVEHLKKAILGVSSKPKRKR